MFDVPEYSSGSECFVTISKRKKNKSKNNKRRFSDEQIRSLEVTFESETKLEPRKKAQLAKELGLQPRQVAIWFQNKRARWKSKQIEKDYNVLLAGYNDLASQFETLKKEKQSLLIQLQNLKNEMVEKPENENLRRIQETTGNSSSEGGSDYTRTKMDSQLKSDLNKHMVGVLSDNDHELLKMAESPLASSDDWGNNNNNSLDSDDLINQTDENCQWWDFWC